jgi:hypothetical protein
MINIVFFRKINPNYSRSRIIEPAKQDLSNSIYILFGNEDNSLNKINKITTSGIFLELEKLSRANRAKPAKSANS